MKNLGQIAGILLILNGMHWMLNSLGIINLDLPSQFYAIFNLPPILLGVFIFLLSSKLK
jgi:hypothetical protein